MKKEAYQRTNITIIEFQTEEVIMTSGAANTNTHGIPSDYYEGEMP